MDRHRRQTGFGLALLFAVGLLPAGAGWAADLNASQVIGDHAAGQVAIQFKDPAQTVPYNADAFGTGTGGWDFAEGNLGPITTGLNLGSYNLYNTANGNIRLDLNGGPITSDTGRISTAQSGANRDTGSIIIRQVGAILMRDGYLDSTTQPASGSYEAGDIWLGQDGVEGPRAGDIQMAYLKAGGGVRGSIVIHGTGYVHMVNNSTGQPGDLVNWGTRNTTPGTNICVLHNGAFRADTVGTTSHARANDNAVHHEILLNGWVLGIGVPAGAFLAGRIVSRATLASNATNNRQIHSDHVNVVNYASVTVTGNVETATSSAHDSWRNTGIAGNVTITGVVGNIAIGGTVDASSNKSGNPVANRGALTLQAGGTITLGSLSLALVKHAAFDPGQTAEINGAITGTDGLALAGGDGVLTNTGTALRIPSGKFLRYSPNQNPALGGGSYVLADLAGTAGSGGILTPMVFRGTVFRFLRFR